MEGVELISPPSRGTQAASCRTATVESTVDSDCSTAGQGHCWTNLDNLDSEVRALALSFTTPRRGLDGCLYVDLGELGTAVVSP